MSPTLSHWLVLFGATVLHNLLLGYNWATNTLQSRYNSRQTKRTNLHGEVHVVSLVAGEPKQSVWMSGSEDELEDLVVTAPQVGLGHQRQVVHDPRVAVALAPLVAIRIRRGRLRHQWLGAHVIKQALAVEVEVAQVAVVRSALLLAGLAEDHRVHVQCEVLARQHRYK